MIAEINEGLIDFTLDTGKEITLTFPEMTQVEDLIRLVRQVQNVHLIKQLKLET